MSCRLHHLALTVALGSLTSTAFGQIGPTSSLETTRMSTFGAASVAADNDTGRSGLTGASNGTGSRAMGGIDYQLAPAKLTSGSDDGEDRSTDIHSSSLHVYGLVPLTRSGPSRASSGVGFGAGRQSMSLGKSDALLAQRDFLYGSGTLGLGSLSLGLVAHMSHQSSGYEDTYDEEEGGETISRHYESKGDHTYTNMSLGAAWMVSSTTRLAVTYAPRYSHWYKLKSTSRVVNKVTGVIESKDYDDDYSQAFEAETINVGGQFKMPAGGRLLVGAQREVPNYDEHGSGNSYDTSAFDGNTLLSLGGELAKAGIATPRMGLSNMNMREGDLRKISAGVDLNVNTAIVSIGVAYSTLNMDFGDSHLKFNSTSGTLGVGAHF